MIAQDYSSSRHGYKSDPGYNSGIPWVGTASIEFHDHSVTAEAKQLFGCIRICSIKYGYTWASLKTIAVYAGMSISTAKRHDKALREAGWVRLEQRKVEGKMVQVRLPVPLRERYSERILNGDYWNLMKGDSLDELKGVVERACLTRPTMTKNKSSAPSGSVTQTTRGRPKNGPAVRPKNGPKPDLIRPKNEPLIDTMWNVIKSGTYYSLAGVVADAHPSGEHLFRSERGEKISYSSISSVTLSKTHSSRRMNRLQIAPGYMNRLHNSPVNMNQLHPIPFGNGHVPFTANHFVAGCKNYIPEKNSAAAGMVSQPTLSVAADSRLINTPGAAVAPSAEGLSSDAGQAENGAEVVWEASMSTSDPMDGRPSLTELTKAAVAKGEEAKAKHRAKAKVRAEKRERMEASGEAEKIRKAKEAEKRAKKKTLGSQFYDYAKAVFGDHFVGVVMSPWSIADRANAKRLIASYDDDLELVKGAWRHMCVHWPAYRDEMKWLWQYPGLGIFLKMKDRFFGDYQKELQREKQESISDDDLMEKLYGKKHAKTFD